MKRIILCSLLVSISSFASINNTHLAFMSVNPDIGAYKAKAYTSHSVSATFRAGTCAVKILEKTLDENGDVKSLKMIYKSSRSQPKVITLNRDDEGRLRGVPFINEYAESSRNPVVELVGSGASFGILITTDKTEFAAVVGMDGERHCQNFEENPITDSEFDKY